MELSRRKSVQLLLLNSVYLIFFIGLSYAAFYAYRSFNSWIAIFAMLFAFVVFLAFLSKRQNELALTFLSCFDVRWRGGWSTVVFPALLMLLLHKIVLQWTWILTSGGELLGAVLVGVIGQPFLEELLYRGILVGATTTFAKLFLKKAGVELTFGIRLAVNTVGILGAAYIFTLDHAAAFSPLLFALGVLYGVLYIANDRNLLPSYFAHAINNLLVILYNLDKFVV